ncbi:MAG TPA: D-glucuronyl C5-epimerase family protein [Solirubrobacteraceae bacterium]|nr:D-glucuronyl C5-epimerase family protein [Solirubrobacteraceae bacterium]
MRVKGVTTVLACLSACALAAPPGPGPQPALAASRPHLAPAARARGAARASLTVSVALTRLLRAGGISEASYARYAGAYAAARSSLSRLSGTRRTELGAVLANVQAIAAAGALTPSRMPALFLTLERNRQWWTTEPLIASGERVSFPGSKIVWQYYAGQGIEIQWLATFGEANGYYTSGHENANLRQLLGEVIPLATERAGGIAWEYLFRFDGGTPPWTSGLSQGTALQVLARAWSRFKEPLLLESAQKAVGIFEQAPPQGVRVPTPAGATYAEYSYAPGDRILNGFIQSLVGLYEYTSITKDPLGLQLFEAGDAEARAEVPHYDTGAWSLYDQYGESNLNYHELLTEFLQHLCERTRRGEPYAPPAGESPPGPGTPGGAPPTGASTTPTPTGSGGAAAPATAIASMRARLAQSAAAIPGDSIYCTTAQRFTTDLSTPPTVSLLTRTLRGATRAGLQIALSKLSTVNMTVRKGSRVVWTNTATVEGGRPRLLWVTPSAGGMFTVTLAARDLVGNFSTASGTVVVSHH